MRKIEQILLKAQLYSLNLELQAKEGSDEERWQFSFLKRHWRNNCFIFMNFCFGIQGYRGFDLFVARIEFGLIRCPHPHRRG